VKYGQWQTRLNTWATRVFGIDHLQDPVVRGKRLVEESIEFAQSVGVHEDDILLIVGHVYSRPPGEPFQELGGVSLTFLAACTAMAVDANHATHAELERVEAKGDAHFQKRNAEKKELFG
jgi:hypothetical protein